jgi:hypothetical protein
MKKNAVLILSFLVAALIVACAPSTTVRRELPAQLVGTYAGIIATPGFPDRDVSLALNGDASAVLSVDPDVGAPIVTWGRWTERGGSILVQMLDADLAPLGSPIVWNLQGEQLLPKKWPVTIFGEKGLILRKQ